jgi:hypothetical protein
MRSKVQGVNTEWPNKQHRKAGKRDMIRVSQRDKTPTDGRQQNSMLPSEYGKARHPSVIEEKQKR